MNFIHITMETGQRAEREPVVEPSFVMRCST
jgi:hypothetical protein